MPVLAASLIMIALLAGCASSATRVVTLNGARQAGKSTLARLPAARNPNAYPLTASDAHFTAMFPSKPLRMRGPQEQPRSLST